jgi:hypothetical protein
MAATLGEGVQAVSYGHAQAVVAIHRYRVGG